MGFRYSNFQPCTIIHVGHRYPSVEHFYQAMKTLDPAEREWVRAAPMAAEAKARGQRVTMRPDWDAVKVDVMQFALSQKFVQEPYRSRLARDTEELVEWNTWHDTYWGCCTCPRHGGEGENWLGRLIEQLRGRA